MKIKQFVSKLPYKSERNVMGKIKQRKAAGRSPGNVNCTGFLRRTMSGHWYKATGTGTGYWYKAHTHGSSYRG